MKLKPLDLLFESQAREQRWEGSEGPQRARIVDWHACQGEQDI